jgi:hypothetical protein
VHPPRTGIVAPQSPGFGAVPARCLGVTQRRDESDRGVAKYIFTIVCIYIIEIYNKETTVRRRAFEL